MASEAEVEAAAAAIKDICLENGETYEEIARAALAAAERVREERVARFQEEFDRWFPR